MQTTLQGFSGWRALSWTTFALCFAGLAFGDGNRDELTRAPAAVAQRASDPDSLQRVSTSEYARAQQFTDGASENTPELQIGEAKDVQIPDARRFTAKAETANRPVRVFEVVSNNSSFTPVGEKTPLTNNGATAVPASLIDNPEYFILLIFGIVMLIIIAFGRRWDSDYRMDPVGRPN